MMAALSAPAARKRTASPRPAPVLALLVSLLASAAPGARAQAPPAPAGRTLELGFEERVRTENWDNSTDFNRKTVDARHQWRLRTRAWGRLALGSKAEFMVGLNDESFEKSTPRQALALDETVFETCYLDLHFADGAALKVGRQNLAKGDGFLLMDGGPLDGSRASYCNAADLSWTAGKSRLDLLAIADPNRDLYLPRIHDKRKPLIEHDEYALGLYASDARREHTTFEGYYFFKSEVHDTRARTNPAWQPDRAIHTLGGRAVHSPGHGLTFTAELAGQLGEQQPATDVHAWAFSGSVKKSFAQAWAKPFVLVGWTGLSGDDPATPANEGWDPLFSRWPRWSELLVYTLAAEHGATYWTNFSMGQAEVQAAPIPALNLRATYYRLAAFHPYPGKPSVFAGGSQRGDLVEGRADVKLNDCWRGHVVAEHMAPGSFYTDHDSGWFFRAEVVLTFKRAFGV